MTRVYCPRCGRPIALTVYRKLHRHNTCIWRTQTARTICPASGTHPWEWESFGIRGKIGTHSLQRLVVRSKGSIIRGDIQPKKQDKVEVQSATQLGSYEWLECIVDNIGPTGIYFLSR